MKSRNCTVPSIVSMIVLTVIIALSAQSCRSSKPLTITTLKSDSILVVERIHDTTIIIPPDSAWLKAWIQCDSTGNVLMRQLELKSSNFLIPMARLESVAPFGAILSLDCKTDSLEMIIRLKERTIQHLQQTQTTQSIEVERKLTWWQRIQIHLGRVLLALLAAAVFYAIIKLKH